MKRVLWIIGLAVGLALLLFLLHFINRGRMGKVTDLAYDPARDRLYAVAGDNGLYTFSVADGRLKLLSRFYDEGIYRKIEIQGERAYIAEQERGLVVLDIREERPRYIYSVGDLQGQGLHLAGGLLYLAAGEDGLLIYSLADPNQPREISRYSDLEDARDVAVEGHVGYISDVARGLEILELSFPTQPARIGFATWDPVDAQAEVIAAEGGFVYIASGTLGLKIVDARNPTTPVIAAEYQPGPQSSAMGLDVRNWTLYLAIVDELDSAQNGLHILDVRNPYSPQVLALTMLASLPSQGFRIVSVISPENSQPPMENKCPGSLAGACFYRLRTHTFVRSPACGCAIRQRLGGLLHSPACLRSRADISPAASDQRKRLSADRRNQSMAAIGSRPATS